MRELVRVPAHTGLKIQIQTLEPAEFRVVLVNNETKQAFYDEVVLVTSVKAINTEFFLTDMSVMLIIKTLSATPSKPKITLSRRRPKRRPAAMPNFKPKSWVRGGGGGSSSKPDSDGGFLIQADDATAYPAYVLQSATGGKIVLNGSPSGA